MQLYFVPGFISVFSLAVIWAALQLDISPPMIVGDSMQPRVFPIFLMIVNLVLSALLTIQYRNNSPKVIQRQSYHTWLTILLFVVFYFVTIYLDMFIAIALVLFCMCLVWGEQRIFIAGAVALVTPVTIFFLFDLVLRVRFPRGLLTNWYYG